ncbi:MAG: V-type ATP synthase subunit F [Spirochaetales bacterium]|nr:V-type ATP synthase subunit F [Spirochaetales bacterium]
MKYFVIGDEDTVLGFGMVGVRGRQAASAQEAEQALTDAMENADIGIILINERLAELIRPLVDRFVFTRQFPLILEIPDRMGRLEGKPSLKELVNEAIGIKL